MKGVVFVEEHNTLTGLSGWGVSGATREQQCQLALQKLKALTLDEHDWICNLSTAAAVLWQYLEDISWCGFYRRVGDDLVLGPFQGKPACRRLHMGKGVCSAAVTQDETQLVPDVHAFPGHIACDSASCSELVVPIHHGGEVIAVLDIDSTSYNRFDEKDQQGMEAVCAYLDSHCHWEL